MLDNTTASDAAFRARVQSLIDAPHDEDSLTWRIAKALNREGAWCGDCDFEDGIEGCSQCRKTLIGYAHAAIDAMKGPEPRVTGRQRKHNHTRYRHIDGGPWSPCPDTCPLAPEGPQS